MAKYLEKVKALLGQFRSQTIARIPRSENLEADALARLASRSDVEGLVSFPIDQLDQPSIERMEEVLFTENATTWMDPILDYLTCVELPEDREEAQRVKNTSVRYIVIGDKLYRRGYSASYQRCIGLSEAEYLLKEVHSGVCETTRGG